MWGAGSRRGAGGGQAGGQAGGRRAKALAEGMEALAGWGMREGFGARKARKKRERRGGEAGHDYFTNTRMLAKLGRGG